MPSSSGIRMSSGSGHRTPVVKLRLRLTDARDR
jgi:hypothetical protein